MVKNNMVAVTSVSIKQDCGYTAETSSETCWVAQVHGDHLCSWCLCSSLQNFIFDCDLAAVIFKIPFVSLVCWLELLLQMLQTSIPLILTNLVDYISVMFLHVIMTVSQSRLISLVSFSATWTCSLFLKSASNAYHYAIYKSVCWG